MLSLKCALCGSILFAAEARSGDTMIIVILYFRFPYNARDQGEQEKTKKGDAVSATDYPTDRVV